MNAAVGARNPAMLDDAMRGTLVTARATFLTDARNVAVGVRFMRRHRVSTPVVSPGTSATSVIRRNLSPGELAWNLRLRGD